MELINRPTLPENQTSLDVVRVRLTMNLTSFLRNLIRILNIKEQVMEFFRVNPFRNRSG
jgi:hypothetical protein